MNGATTNSFDLMIALININKPYDDETANGVAKTYEILKKKLQEV